MNEKKIHAEKKGDKKKRGNCKRIQSGEEQLKVEKRGRKKQKQKVNRSQLSKYFEFEKS